MPGCGQVFGQGLVGFVALHCLMLMRLLSYWNRQFGEDFIINFATLAVSKERTTRMLAYCHYGSDFSRGLHSHICPP